MANKMVMAAAALGSVAGGVLCWGLGLFNGPVEAVLATALMTMALPAILWGVTKILEDA